MPLYDLKKLQELIRDGQYQYLNEEDGRKWRGLAWKTMDNLGWEEEDLVKMLLALDECHWQTTAQNCAVGNCYGLQGVDADQYEIHWDEDEGVWREAPQLGLISISLKLALIQLPSGDMAGLVTLHSSGSK
ncbi:hypothetical protein [Pandoraea commovens]|uniref:Uncharacterized protein n=1 Tax=Pandoraea commovens TaxID=2508289 RepID=A0ABY5QI45_9BURK|nr:hypothetical protein [Pandoraea commovens]UVA80486.1 hypothetical protein NTU39_05535 [Pandoraea commovens]